jgi:hypothetical protein
MKHNFTTRFLVVLLAVFVLVSGCASTTMIQSSPSGAKLFLNGETVGTTPYSHTDTKIVGSTTHVRLEKEGYEPLNTAFSRDEEVDVGAIIGGLFVWVPFLWIMKYKPVRTYELKPFSGNDFPLEKQIMLQDGSSSKSEKLRELKKLLDDKIITQEEFDAEKKKILDEK